MSAATWDALRDELDCWRAAGMCATFWWRDDDAVNATPALDDLLACAGGVPLAMAVIPAHADRSLAERFAACPNVTVLQHGWAHVSHVAGRNDEYPAGRDAADVDREVREGQRRLRALFGDRAMPVFVPPWHGFDARFLPVLAANGISGFSRKGARNAARLAPGIVQANAHVAPIAWSDPPGFASDGAYLATVVEHLAGRRTGRHDAHEPTGLLTHHLAQNPSSYAFIARLVDVVSGHPAATWVSAREIFAA